MKGTSQASHDAMLREFDPVASAAGKDGATLAEQLFTVVDSLDRSGSLRRALTDPARPGSDKAALVSDLFGAMDQRVIDFTSAAVGARWSGEDDLGDTLEAAAVDALLASAEKAKQLDTVEEELFLVERALSSQTELLSALDNRSAAPEPKLELARKVFGSKVNATTLALLERAVTAPRMRRVVAALESFIAAAAQRRERSVVKVVSAVELSAKQRGRLADILRSAYGREVQINASVDPHVIGGIRVQVGSEVVDGTVLSRLDEARQKIAG